ncbi:MAG: hypothetical protein JSS27_09275 [Planctomycetes bacterium]|nr:hypothetical protein [Planctomycetota bacterium]
MNQLNEPEHNKPPTHEQIRKVLAQAMSELLTGEHPGPQSFRPKPTKKASSLYPLKLTKQQ